MPGPSQTNWAPSPVVQVTDCGTAVAVAVTGPAEADALNGCHMDRSNHSHVLKFTTENGVGLVAIDGDGKVS